jgi:hypothetical protein
LAHEALQLEQEHAHGLVGGRLLRRFGQSQTRTFEIACTEQLVGVSHDVLLPALVGVA